MSVTKPTPETGEVTSLPVHDYKVQSRALTHSRFADEVSDDELHEQKGRRRLQIKESLVGHWVLT